MHAKILALKCLFTGYFRRENLKMQVNQLQNIIYFNKINLVKKIVLYQFTNYLHIFLKFIFLFFLHNF